MDNRSTTHEPVTKTFGVELSAEEINEVSGAWPKITIEESDNYSLTITVSAVEVTVEF